METAIAQQGILLLYSMIYGVALGVFYDLFRLLRIMFIPSKVGAFLQDILFCLSSAIITFLYIFTFNQGIIRLYILALILLGWAVYYFTLGSVIYKISKKAVDALKERLSRAAKVVAAPFYKLWQKSAVPWAALKSKVKGHLFKHKRKKYVHSGGKYAYSRMDSRKYYSTKK